MLFPDEIKEPAKEAITACRKVGKKRKPFFVNNNY